MCSANRAHAYATNTCTCTILLPRSYILVWWPYYESLLPMAMVGDHNTPPHDSSRPAAVDGDCFSAWSLMGRRNQPTLPKKDWSVASSIGRGIVTTAITLLGHGITRPFPFIIPRKRTYLHNKCAFRTDARNQGIIILLEWNWNWNCYLLLLEHVMK